MLVGLHAGQVPLGFGRAVLNMLFEPLKQEGYEEDVKNT